MTSTVRSSMVTSEAVALDFETAGLGSRVSAFAIDAVVRLLLVSMGLGMLGPVASRLSSGMATVLIIAAGFTMVFGYSAGFEAWRNGQTPGKQALGLRVVTVDGGPIRFSQAATRAVCQVVDVLLLPPGLLGAALIATSPRDQRLGDLLASTVVRRESTAVRPPPPVSFPPLPGTESFSAALDVAALRPDQYAVLRSFLVRVHQLEPRARARLAARLTEVVAATVGRPIPPGMHPEGYLVSVAAAYQARWGGPPVPIHTRHPAMQQAWITQPGSHPPHLGGGGWTSRSAPPPGR